MQVSSLPGVEGKAGEVGRLGGEFLTNRKVYTWI